jgi:hypothetical protein
MMIKERWDNIWHYARRAIAALERIADALDERNRHKD